MLDDAEVDYEDPVSLESITDQLDTLEGRADCTQEGNWWCETGCFPLIVRSTGNVVLGTKTFTTAEISNLSTINSDLQTQSTLDIFNDIDQLTRECNLEWETVVDSTDGKISTYTKDADTGLKTGINYEEYSLTDHIDWPVDGVRTTGRINTYIDDVKQGFEIQYYFKNEGEAPIDNYFVLKQ